MSDTEQHLETRQISAPRVGKFNVHVQGDLKHRQFVILTVHDLGCNHNQWNNFLNHWSMQEITKRAAFIHIDIPGQEDDAPDLPAEYPPKKGSGISICYTFPTMQSLGEDIICVLDQLDVKQVVCIGEGAGANIVARFAIAQPSRVFGVCLIHCTGTTAGFMESLKDKVIGWKLEQIGMNPTAETYLVLHRFGSFEKAKNKEDLNKVIATFQNSLRHHINPHNLHRFVQSFMKRTNILDSIGKLKCQVLMITGTKASFNHTVHNLYGHMLQKVDKKQLELLEVEGVANVIEEKTEKLGEAFLYFCQGLGLIGGVPMTRVSRSSSMDGADIPLRKRSMSMEEADKPLGIYSSSPARTAPLSTSPKSGIQMSTSPPRIPE
ncbi:uncharacterized protein ZK1073.1-like isoform X1 [Mytilus galloprovincialis]|uniref:uncharacterized protein ZK1073.1-like isoform X1 n=1 Tax=Mytilus galloprovincialis TaxID=29158 RepID=UPI003F7C45AC